VARGSASGATLTPDSCEIVPHQTGAEMVGSPFSSSQWLFKIGIKGLWSVTMVKCCRPPRNMWHLATAHVIVSSSNSMTTYRDSAEVKK